MYIQVNIGRNIGDTPMSDNMWDMFKEQIAQIIRRSVKADYRDVSGLNIEFHEGLGMWGNQEDSCHISLYDERGFDLLELQRDLKWMRSEYEQDSVALIIGSELI